MKKQCYNVNNCLIILTGGSERYSSRGGRGEHSNSYKRPRVSIQNKSVEKF